MCNKFYSYRTTALVVCTLLTGCTAGGYTSGNSTLGAMENAAENMVLGSMTQGLSSSVLNGQISSQLPQVDQNYRMQQLSTMIQSGGVNQYQQWTNPQTGSNTVVNPVGKNAYNKQYQQQCQPMQETMTLPNGQTFTESRLACLNSQTGQWILVQ